MMFDLQRYHPEVNQTKFSHWSSVSTFVIMCLVRLMQSSIYFQIFRLTVVSVTCMEKNIVTTCAQIGTVRQLQAIESGERASDLSKKIDVHRCFVSI